MNLTEASTLYPLAQKFCAFRTIAPAAGDHDIFRVVGSTLNDRHDVVYIVSLPVILVAVVAFTFLRGELPLNVFFRQNSNGATAKMVAVFRPVWVTFRVSFLLRPCFLRVDCRPFTMSGISFLSVTFRHRLESLAAVALIRSDVRVVISTGSSIQLWLFCLRGLFTTRFTPRQHAIRLTTTLVKITNRFYCLAFRTSFINTIRTVNVYGKPTVCQSSAVNATGIQPIFRCTITVEMVDRLTLPTDRTCFETIVRQCAFSLFWRFTYGFKAIFAVALQAACRSFIRTVGTRGLSLAALGTQFYWLRFVFRSFGFWFSISDCLGACLTRSLESRWQRLALGEFRTRLYFMTPRAVFEVVGDAWERTVTRSLCLRRDDEILFSANRTNQGDSGRLTRQLANPPAISEGPCRGMLRTSLRQNIVRLFYPIRPTTSMAVV